MKLHKVEHPTLPVDPLFYEDITLHELAGEIKNLNSDKSPGDDGITNRMIQAAGPKFTNLLHDVSCEGTNLLRGDTSTAPRPDQD